MWYIMIYGIYIYRERDVRCEKWCGGTIYGGGWRWWGQWDWDAPTFGSEGKEMNEQALHAYVVKRRGKMVWESEWERGLFGSSVSTVFLQWWKQQFKVISSNGVA